MIAKVLPSILGRNILRSAQTQSMMGGMGGMGGMGDMVNQITNTLSGIGGSTGVRSNDSGGEFTEHPAKM